MIYQKLISDKPVIVAEGLLNQLYLLIPIVSFLSVVSKFL